MARIRKLSIRNFRSIQLLDWSPSPGINCLVGPGDSGKSSILDAIDLCLGARRSASFSDTDFHCLNVDVPIQISITLGELNDDLMNIESYGDYLQGFNPVTAALEDEPGVGLETVLTLRLKVEADLEPEWALVSVRAEQQGLSRGLMWKDRASLAPARIGAYASSNLSWSRNSVLNRLTDDRANLGAELANAAREARRSFGDQAAAPLAETLQIVTQTATSLGVPVGIRAQALLDAHSVSIGDGAIALHSDTGIPLRSLGTGSSRLLIAGLQREAANRASIALVDEVEFGLEPHRLISFLNSLGAKNTEQPLLQAFITTHSPVALRELTEDQLFVVRKSPHLHTVTRAGSVANIQGTLRTDPEAFLARFVLVCEGNSEVGLVRGIDLYRVAHMQASSVYALGGAYVNVGGGIPENCFRRGTALLQLGYKAIVFVDADKPILPEAIAEFIAAGGQYITWQNGRALEDELFASMSDVAIDALLALAKERIGPDIVVQHVQTTSENQINLQLVEAARPQLPYAPLVREYLGKAAKSRNNGWYKSLGVYQHIGENIVCPNYQHASLEFQAIINTLWGYINAAGN
jgi:predicted ATPase